MERMEQASWYCVRPRYHQLAPLSLYSFHLAYESMWWAMPASMMLRAASGILPKMGWAVPLLPELLLLALVMPTLCIAIMIAGAASAVMAAICAMEICGVTD